MEINLQKALSNPLWVNHVRNKNLYSMDGKKENWAIVYYPIFQNGETNEYYEEPRALLQNMDKPGFWSKEVPLRYLTLNK